MSRCNGCSRARAVHSRASLSPRCCGWVGWALSPGHLTCCRDCCGAGTPGRAPVCLVQAVVCGTRRRGPPAHRVCATSVPGRSLHAVCGVAVCCPDQHRCCGPGVTLCHTISIGTTDLECHDAVVRSAWARAWIVTVLSCRRAEGPRCQCAVQSAQALRIWTDTARRGVSAVSPCDRQGAADLSRHCAVVPSVRALRARRVSTLPYDHRRRCGAGVSLRCLAIGPRAAGLTFLYSVVLSGRALRIWRLNVLPCSRQWRCGLSLRGLTISPGATYLR